DLLLWGRSAAVYPEGPAGHNGLGVALRHEGRTEEAIAEFKKSFECPGPFKVPPCMNLGTSYFALGKIEEAERKVSIVNQNSPAFVSGLVWDARMREQLGKADDAALLLDRAAAVAPADKELAEALKGRTPDRARGFADLGSAFANMGRSADAEAAAK